MREKQSLRQYVAGYIFNFLLSKGATGVEIMKKGREGAVLVPDYAFLLKHYFNDNLIKTTCNNKILLRTPHCRFKCIRVCYVKVI